MLGLLLAGCSSSVASPTTAPAPFAEDLHLKATPTTGIVRGIVVDDGIRPLAGASIQLRGGGLQRSGNSTASGAFGFSELPAGSYLLRVHKSGFLDAQVTADVVAGQDAPPVVKVQLAVNSSYLPPFSQVRKIAGFIECTGNPVALCGIPNNYRPTACGTNPALCYSNVTSDRVLFWIDMPGNVSFLQAEMFWRPTSDLNTRLGWNHVAGKGCAGIDGTNNATYGQSPMAAPMVKRDIRVPGGRGCQLYLGVSAGPPADNFCVPVQLPLLNTVCPGLAIHQDFVILVHAFYGYFPKPGWTFSRDGDLEPPR